MITFSLFKKFWKITRIEDWICVLLIDHASIIIEIEIEMNVHELQRTGYGRGQPL